MFRFFALSFFLLCFFLSLKLAAQSMGNAEFKDLDNGGGANNQLCPLTSVRVRTYAYAPLFAANNQFRVQLSDQNGNFGNPVTMVGGLTSQGGDNVEIIVSVNFPANVTPGSGYRFRVASTNPVRFSNATNAFTITQYANPNYSTTEFGDGLWRSYVYSWQTTTPPPITDASNEDIFNENNKQGYFLWRCLDFDFNWQANAMPGNLIQSSDNFVCGGPRDLFSIRFRRKFNFEPGNYVFTVGGDDGYRFSLDSGQTWHIQDWSEHVYGTKSTADPNGIFLSGPINLVLEFFDRNINARVTFRARKVNDPSTNLEPPLVLPADLNGSTYCNGLPPFNFNISPTGGIYSGSGVSPAGTFNPAAISNLPQTVSITYRVGVAACLKQASFQVNVKAGLSAGFTVPSQICLSASPINLNATNAGGNFSGPGVSGQSFNPQAAGGGTKTIKYVLISGSGCKDSTTQTIEVLPSVKPRITNSDSVFCIKEGGFVVLLKLTGNPDGGEFSGPGVTGNNFNPYAAGAGSHPIKYVSSGLGCKDSIEKIFRVFRVPNPGFSGLPNQVCSNGDSLLLLPQTPGGIFSSPSQGLRNGAFHPKDFARNTFPADVSIKYKVGVDRCIDSSQKTIRVLNFARLNAPNFFNTDSIFCEGSAIVPLNVFPAGGILRGKGIANSSFNATGLMPGTYPLFYLLVPENQCMDTAFARINFRINSKPSADAGNDVTIEEDQSAQLNGKGDGVVRWKPASGLSDTTILNPIANPNSSTKYFLTVSDQSGRCFSRDSVLVTVKSVVFIPNLISANDDGSNDTWAIKGLKNYPDCKIEIFNRWGRKVYSSTGYKQGWSPESNFAEGVYFYHITRQPGEVFKGTLTIVKKS